MKTSRFLEKYNPEFKCYAVYHDAATGLIERGLILDTVQYSLSNKPYININNFHTEVYISQIKAVIVTSVRWTPTTKQSVSL